MQKTMLQVWMDKTINYLITFKNTKWQLNHLFTWKRRKVERGLILIHAMGIVF